MNTNTKGTIGLAKVISDLVEKEFFIFLPLSDTSLIDLIIADKKLSSKKLQIKYVKLNKNGSLYVSFYSVIDRKKVLNDYSKIDAFAIYCPDNKKIYYVPIKDIIGKSLTLKINGRKIKTSKDSSIYEDPNNIFQLKN
mgnify:CR=1 FL=1